MRDRVLECPHCKATNIKTKEHHEEIKLYGKAVIECKDCNKLFLLRDDGDGEYIRAPK
jgi:transposase-like protein